MYNRVTLVSDSVLHIWKLLRVFSMGFPGGAVIKNLPASAGDIDSIPESGRSPGGEHGNPLQYPFLENPTGRGAWRASTHEVEKSQARLSTERRKEESRSEKFSTWGKTNLRLCDVMDVN